MMVPDSKGRLEQAKEELDILLERYQEEGDGSDGALVSEAKALLV